MGAPVKAALHLIEEELGDTPIARGLLVYRDENGEAHLPSGADPALARCGALGRRSTLAPFERCCAACLGRG
jgi:hypothetical protein